MTDPPRRWAIVAHDWGLTEAGAYTLVNRRVHAHATSMGQARLIVARLNIVGSQWHWSIEPVAEEPGAPEEIADGPSPDCADATVIQ